MDDAEGLMTVAELREALVRYPDDMPVFVGVPEGLRISEGIELAMFRPSLIEEQPAGLVIRPTVRAAV